MLTNKLNNSLMVNELAAASEDNNDQASTVVQAPTVGFANLFASASQTDFLSGANQLNKTAQLTTVSTRIANEIFSLATSDMETYGSSIAASQQSHDAMDDLINDLYHITEADYSFLKSISGDEIDKMIRSQQSKRSRAKSKVMTQENYITMLVGAVAENLLRIAGNKPKSAGGGAVMGDIGFSAEDLENLATYPEELKKAIRNVQSKKSIMKAKSGFDATSVRWLQLLRAEQQLKEVRDRVAGTVNEEAKEALEVKAKAEEMLADIDTENIDADTAKQLLEQMKQMLASKE